MDKIIGLGNALVDVLATLDSDEILTKTVSYTHLTLPTNSRV